MQSLIDAAITIPAALIHTTSPSLIDGVVSSIHRAKQTHMWREMIRMKLADYCRKYRSPRTWRTLGVIGRRSSESPPPPHSASTISEWSEQCV